MLGNCLTASSLVWTWMSCSSFDIKGHGICDKSVARKTPTTAKSARIGGNLEDLGQPPAEICACLPTFKGLASAPRHVHARPNHALQQTAEQHWPAVTFATDIFLGYFPSRNWLTVRMAEAVCWTKNWEKLWRLCACSWSRRDLSV